ncbi:hypothetical protein [Aquimarina sp. MMG016]|uniref:hypothetical protein n=1 Tax=Aquimarina sp. MMG016 TaxID=2822690 RepID=UPI001B39F97D|nr:hypothetical protein [Aquimarina sp. MMG016]MBQ4822681.1 hypothetical protein [Aquimarina sp. MMG016]
MLKKFITYYKGLLLALIVLVSSCVNDDSFFPDEVGDNITQSTALVTVLNNFRPGSGDVIISERELCFRFVYPIVLGYNTDSSIRIDNYDGLVSVMSSQSNNFNISGLQFPVQIVFNGNSDTQFTVNNEAALINVLQECNFDTLRHDFDRLFSQCFKFDYPVTLINRDRREIVLSSKEEFNSFYSSQGADYQPELKFPVNLLVAPDFSSKRINTYFEFYEIINDCVGCPNPEFTKELIESPATYRFISTIEQSDVVFFWFINNELVGDVARPTFDYNFLAVLDGSVPGGPGNYEVCLKVETPDCPEGIKFCKEITVEQICPDLLFEFVQEPGTLEYVFTAEFADIGSIRYQWFVDGQQIELDGGPGADNQLLQTLDPGMHEVCIKHTSPLCPDGKEFCKEVLVEPICPDLFFTVEQEGDTPSYNFFAEFPDIANVTYEWVINNDIIEDDGGSNGDNTLFFQFSPGTYEICIRTETPTCPEGIQYCQELIVQ